MKKQSPAKAKARQAETSRTDGGVRRPPNPAQEQRSATKHNRGPVRKTFGRR